MGWPQRGDRMIFLGKNGYEHELKNALEKFETGKPYTVTSCEVGDWHHSIEFKEVAGRFNGVLFQQESEFKSRQTIEALVGALIECEDYLDNRADVKDGDYGIPEPNKEMALLSEVRAALLLAGEKNNG